MDIVTPSSPLAAVAQRIWRECKRAPESSACLLPFVYRLNPGIDPIRLERALRDTVGAHPALRSAIHEVDGKPYQVIRKTPAVVLERADRWEWAITRPFDLENGPLFRFVLCDDIFVVNASQVALDSSSVLMLLEEVGLRYHGRTVPEPDPGPALWEEHERRYLQSADREGDRLYWTQTLGQSDFHVGLPTRRESYRGEKDGCVYFSLRLPQLNASPVGTALALVQALIHRYTEQETVAVMYPTDLRGKLFAHSMGPFVNSVIATASFTPSLTFSQLVEQVTAQWNAARLHDRLSLQEVIAEIRQAAPSDTVQLPNISFDWMRPLSPFALGTPLPLETVDCRNDLLFRAFAEGDRLDVCLQYRSAQFTRRFAEELAQHLALLAGQVVDHPDVPLSRLKLVTAAEVQRIETQWTPPVAPFDGLQLLHEAVASQAERTPDAAALLMLDRTITYREMQRLANRIGHRLRDAGGRPNTLVAVMMEKGWEQAVACLGVLNSGAAYLPINAAWPSERIDSVIEQGEVEIVLSQQRVLDRLGRDGLAVDTPETWRDYADSPLPRVNGLDDICYVIFTSGSTGRPKGVVLSHRSVMNTIRDCNRNYGVTESDRALQLSDLSFDLSVYDIFGMLSAGGGVVIPDEIRHLEPSHWAELARRHRVTLWNSVPMYVDMWVQSQEPLPDVRLFMLSGDKIPVDLPDRVRALMPGVSLWSLGGATEGSIWSIWYEIDRVDPSWSTIPYGHAMTNQEMYVLDAGLNHCPPFMSGRIFIGGMGVAQGYWRDRLKTDAVFLTHPVTGKRIYDTGDLGRWLPEGEIEYLGRGDFQVKINGFRVELGEIEGALQALPGIKAAIVEGREQPTRRGKVLVAYVVSDSPLDAAELRAALRDRLPYYMIPRIFVPLARVPLSANGKVDRKALPSPDVAPIPGAQPHVAPRTEIEATLVAIWQAVLKHEPIGVHDNFYDLGGDSLLSVQIGVKAREAGLRLDPTALHRTPTIAELVQGLEPVRPVPVSEAAGDVPLSPMQRYYFSWATVRPQQFNISAVFRCALEPERLRAALRMLVAHYSSLRLRFQGGRQFYAEEGLEIPLECSDIPLAEVAPRAARMQEMLDIAQGPIMRAALFTTERGQRLVLICHHLVTDGLAWGVLVTDLQRLYLGQSPAPAVGTYKAWVEGLIRYAATPEVEAEIPYWLEQQGPALTPDTDRPGARQRDLVTYVSPMLDHTPSHPYERVAAALVEASGQDRLMLHLVGHGREPVVEGVDPVRLGGWFTTHSPIVLSGGLTEVAAQLHAVPRHGIGHGALRAYHPRGADLAVQDQVRVLYNFFGETWDSSFQGSVFDSPEPELLYLDNQSCADNPADFWIHLFAIIHEGKLVIRFEYCSYHFRHETVCGLAERMRASLQAHLHEPVVSRA